MHKIFRSNLTRTQVMRINKWIKALRGGEYEQCRGQLNKGNTYCCLGVACDVSKLDSWRSNIDENGYPICDDILTENLADSYVYGEDAGIYPPQEVVEFYGLTKENPGEVVLNPLDRFDTGLSLSDLNDNRKYSFAQIADLLEAELKSRKTKSVKTQ